MESNSGRDGPVRIRSSGFGLVKFPIADYTDNGRRRKIRGTRRHYDRVAPMKLRVSSWLLLVAFLIPFPQQALPPAIYGQVDRLAAEEMASLHEPSLSISIVNHGQLIFAKGYGVSDVENNVPATADTVYRIASLSKSRPPPQQ